MSSSETVHRPQPEGTRDIISALPLELLIHIVEFLAPEDIIQSQRVSKNWRTIFSNDKIITAVLRETFKFLGLDAEGVITEDTTADATSYFRWRYGLQHGRPIKQILLPWPEDFRDFMDLPDLIEYKSRRLCYELREDNSVRLVNLENGEISTWTGNEFGSLYNLNLSDRYIFILSKQWDSNCYDLTAHDIHTKQRFDQQVPASEYFQSSIVEDKVVIAPMPHSQSAPVYIWDLSSNDVHEIGGFSNLWLYHMDAVQNVLVAFEIDWEKQPPEVNQTKWTMTTGQQLDKKTFHLPIPKDRLDRELALEPSCNFGHKTVSQIFSEKHTTIHLEYDHTLDRLDLRWIHGAEQFRRNPYKCHSTYMTPYLVCRWTWRTGPLIIYDAATGRATQQSKISLHKDENDYSNPDLRGSISEFDIPGLLCFGDREVLGLRGDRGVQFWFFNPNFTPYLPNLEELSDSDEIFD